MNTQLPDFTSTNVLVIGDVMLDRYHNGSTQRISPEAPVPIVKVEHTEDRPGGAANVACSIAALGGQVKLIGITGDDEAGKSLNEQLTQSTVDLGFLKIQNLATVVKLRVLSHGQQLIRLDFEDSYQSVDKSQLTTLFSESLDAAKLVVLSDYAKGTLSDTQALIQKAKAKNLKIIVDPKGSDFAKYRGVDLITPNLSEFEEIVGSCPDDETLVSRAETFLKDYDIAAILVTRSEKGMTLVTSADQVLHISTTAVSVSDVTGAGDTVISTIASCLAADCKIIEACHLANIAAGVVVTKIGTSTVSRAELAAAFAIHSDTSLGVFSQEQLLLISEDAKRRGEKIVMTNGCFDILHAGHVSYLNSAAKLGDRLIVAINSDSSVKKLKGSDRPINSVSNRMKVIAALGAVDWVVEFDSETPEELISLLLPDILVKGGDYAVEQIAGHKQVLANGGEVTILHFEYGYSTSRTINSIKSIDNFATQSTENTKMDKK